jgi:hypothetical protein
MFSEEDVDCVSVKQGNLFLINCSVTSKGVNKI